MIRNNFDQEIPKDMPANIEDEKQELEKKQSKKEEIVEKKSEDLPPSSQLDNQNTLNLYEAQMKFKIGLRLSDKPPLMIVEQINRLKTYCKLGILNHDDRNKLNITTIQSSDSKISKISCLNYINDSKGIHGALMNEAKGAYNVVLERNDGISLHNLSDFELENRLHLSFLIVMPVKKSKDGDDNLLQIRYVEDQGIIQARTLRDRKIQLPVENKDNTDFCHEISINNSISPENFSYLILPKDLEKHLSITDLNLMNCKVIFVKSTLINIRLPYREIGTTGNIFTKYKFKSLRAPDYTEALNEIWKANKDSGIMTHIVRTPTPNELKNLKQGEDKKK